MDRFYNSKRHSMTNYLDIFKACRLCGSGGGYKMPIIQKMHNDDVIDVEAELKQKIRECVSIEVHPDDRMPPLICELCVDKVNDFYEFREMCRATNARVRASLGLPPQNLSQDINEDCILGVSGPVFHNSSEGVSSKKDKKKKVAAVVDKKPNRSKEATPPPVILDRSSRRRPTDSPILSTSSKRLRFSSPSSSSSSPLPDRRSSRGSDLKDKTKKEEPKKEPKPPKGNLLQKQKELMERQKTKEAKAKELAAKIKKTQREVAQKAKELKEKARQAELKRQQRVKEAAEQKAKEAREAAALKKKQQQALAQPPTTKCEHCAQAIPKPEYKQHIEVMHTPLYTDEKLACTPCQEWFTSVKDAEAHHKWHKTANKPYNCQRCDTEFKVLLGFTKHFQRKQCVPYDIVPDVKCSVCQGMFVTESWLQQHKCAGPPKDMCRKCMAVFQGRVALKRHERRCKGIIVPVNPNNPLLNEVRPLSISLDRCDHLVRRIKTEPGLITTFKQEPMDFEETAINIKSEIKSEPEDYDYSGYGGMDDGGYSSDGTSSETEAPTQPHLVINPFARKNTNQVDSLSVISLRSIFGGKLLNKRTKKRKRRNPKVEMMAAAENTSTSASAFDNLFNENTDNTDAGEGNTQSSNNQSTFDSLFDNGNANTDANADSNVDDIPGLDKDIHVNDITGVSAESQQTTGDDQQAEETSREETNVPEDEEQSKKDVEMLAENVLNEIIERADMEVDSTRVEAAQEVTQEKTDDVVEQDKDASVDTTVVPSESSIEETNTPVTENVERETICVISSSKPEKKSFVQGFALDPEVEALLREDSTEATELKEKEPFDTDISSIIDKDLLVSNKDQSEAVPMDESLSQMENNIDSSQVNETNYTGNEMEEQVVSNHVVDERQEEQNIEAKNDEVKGVKENEIPEKETVTAMDIVNENAVDSYGDSENKDETETSEKKGDDIMDLISDSGDDCNIVDDSPDKPKLSEEQLLDEIQQDLDTVEKPTMSDQILNEIQQSLVSELKEDISESKPIEDIQKDSGSTEKQNLLDKQHQQVSDVDTSEKLVLPEIAEDIPDNLDLPDKDNLTEEQLLDDVQASLPEIPKLSEDELLDEIQQNLEETSTCETEKKLDNLDTISENSLLDDEKQIEESLLAVKDDGITGDMEITQQDEDLLLGKDDLTQTADREVNDQYLEKISDDEFDME